MICSCDLFSCTCTFTADPPRAVRPQLNPKAAARFHAVDPGVLYYARATFTGGALVAVSLLDTEHRAAAFTIEPVTTLVLEMPQIIERAGGTRQGAARKKDVAELIFSAGRIADRYDNVVRYTPSQWKGQLGKTECHARTWAALTTEEQSIINAIKTKEERGHIMDAVGLGLVYLWRR